MNIPDLPWLEFAILTAMIGSLWVSQVHHPSRAWHCALIFTGTVLTCILLAWLIFASGNATDARHFSLQLQLFGRRLFELDQFNAPLVAAVALLHFMTALATARTKMRLFSFSWSLAAEAIRLATFCCSDPAVMVGLLIVSTIPPYMELVNQDKPRRLFVIHMTLFAGLLVLGYACLRAGEQFSLAGIILFAAALLVHSGAFPTHCWVTDWLEHASFGNAILFLAPLTGVYVAIRLVLPAAPEWLLHVLGLVSLATAIYSAGMAIVQRDTRRFFAFFFLSQSSLILVGLDLQTPSTLTAALSLWLSGILSLGGFGLILRALEARFGRMSLVGHHGLYEHVPTLAISYLVMGLACVGFPFTIGFVSTDLLVDGAIEANLPVGMAVIAVAALNGIAVVRTYLLMFTGARHRSTVALGISVRERIAILTLIALIVIGGLFPQPSISARS